MQEADGPVPASPTPSVDLSPPSVVNPFTPKASSSMSTLSSLRTVGPKSLLRACLLKTRQMLLVIYRAPASPCVQGTCSPLSLS